MITLEKLTIDGENEKGLKTGASKIVLALNTEWKVEDLKYKIYTSGLTNKLIGVWHRLQKPEEQVLVRVYGKFTHLFIDRKAEEENIQLLQPHGCGPRLLAKFVNGLCYSFVVGRPLQKGCVRQPGIYSEAARRVATLHSIPGYTKCEKPVLYTKLDTFLSLLPADFSKESKLKKAAQEGYSKAYLTDQRSFITSAITPLECPLAFCHNDLLLENLIWNEATEQLSLLDFEYGGSNFQAFDVANHFVEFSGTDLGDFDLSLFPSEEYQKKWLTIYLSCLTPPSPCPLPWWLEAVRVFAMAAHLFWGSWALLQACHADDSFDYQRYAILKLDAYRAMKDKHLTTLEKKSP